MNTLSVQESFVDKQIRFAANNLINKIIRIKNERNLDYETIDLTTGEWKSLFKSIESWIDWEVLKEGVA